MRTTATCIGSCFEYEFVSGKTKYIFTPINWWWK